MSFVAEDKMLKHLGGLESTPEKWQKEQWVSHALDEMWDVFKNNTKNKKNEA